MTVALTKMTAMNKTCFKHPLHFTLLRNKVALYFLASGLPHYKKNFITKRIEKLCRKVKAGKTNAKFYEHDMAQLTQKKTQFRNICLFTLDFQLYKHDIFCLQGLFCLFSCFCLKQSHNIEK